MKLLSYRSKRALPSVLLTTLILSISGCGGTDTATDAESGNPSVSNAGRSSRSITELVVCGLVSSDEISQIIGQPAGGAKPEQPYPPLFSCRYEDETITPAVQVSIAAWDDETMAVESFDIADKYPRVTGIGDRAYNSQPFGDLTVLHGRYEVSVDVAFLSESRDVDFDAATQIARIVLTRLE
jgi:hypothetical protein